MNQACSIYTPNRRLSIPSQKKFFKKFLAAEKIRAVAHFVIQNFFRERLRFGDLFGSGNFSQIAPTAFSVKSNLDNLYLSVVLGMVAAILTLGAVYGGEEDKTSMKILFAGAPGYSVGLDGVSYIMALSVEELGGNIIRWSFKSAKKNTISIYLVFKDNETPPLKIWEFGLPFRRRKMSII